MSFDVFYIKVCGGILAVGVRKNPKNSRVNISMREDMRA